MIIVKGYDILFIANGGKKYGPGRDHGLMHDPSGKDWPKCSLFTATFRKTKALAEDEHAIEYLGNVARIGYTIRPVADLQHWKRIGEAESIYYTRVGEHEGDFVHDFGEWTLLRVKIPSRPVLYQRGMTYRLELGSTCELDWRGFISP